MIMKKIWAAVLVAPMLLASAAPAIAQRGGHGNFYNGARRGGHGGHYDRGRRHDDGIGPGKGAAIGVAGGAALGLLFGGGVKGAIVGGAAGAGIGAIAGQAAQDNRRDRYGRRY